MEAIVASLVLDILGSFSNSLGLSKKLRKKIGKKKRAKQSDPAEEGELRLAKSLRRGHDDITLEYRKSKNAVGQRFDVGDGELRVLHKSRDVC